MFLERLSKCLKKSLDNSTDRSRRLRVLMTETLQDIIYTLNQIEAVEKVEGKTAEEKVFMRNSIIKAQRNIFTDKLIELDTIRKPESNSN